MKCKMEHWIRAMGISVANPLNSAETKQYYFGQQWTLGLPVLFI